MRLTRAVILVATSVGLGMCTPWRPEPAAGHPSMSATLRPSPPPGPRDDSCQPPRKVKRTFVGFAEGGDGAGDFEPAAVEATRILELATVESCDIGAKDASGTLGAALHNSFVEITAVLFRRQDLAVADVQMQRRGETDPEWLVRVERAPEGQWRIVSARKN